MTPIVTIRSATVEDIEPVRQIYAHYVEKTVLTFRHKLPPKEALLAAFHSITNQQHLPFIVAIAGSELVSYSYADGFRGYSIGYAPTIELTLFCHPDHCGVGIGSRLLEHLLEQLRNCVHVTREPFFDEETVIHVVNQVIAVMAVDEHGPGKGLALRDWYIKKGFQEVGRLQQVGYKKDR